MMKHLHFSALFLMLVFGTAWKEKNENELLKDLVRPETKDVTASLVDLRMDADRANFSGDWKLNESKSERDGQFPICIFGEGDRSTSKTIKVAEHGDFLTVTVARPLPYGRFVTSQEIVTFDGKSEATIVGSPREKSSARWSDDGQTMTINSVKSFYTISEDADIAVTEVWKLINDGNSISVQVISNSGSGENTMKLIYDRL